MKTTDIQHTHTGLPAPAVSVIMPVYNAEAHLDRSVGSVVAQTSGDWELICFNDASVDGSLALLNRWAALDCRIRIIDSPVNVRQGEGRNRAIDAARGRYMMFLDADDALEPQAVATCLSAAVKTGADMVLFGYTVVDGGSGNGHSSRAVFPLGDDAQELDTAQLQLRLIERPSPVWTAMYSRQVWTGNDLRFPAGVFYEDNAVALAAQLSAVRPTAIGKPLLRYTVHPGSVSHRRNDYRFFHRLSGARILAGHLHRLGLYRPEWADALDWVLLRQYLVHTVYGCIYRFDRVPLARLRYAARSVGSLVPGGYRGNRYYRSQPLAARLKLRLHLAAPRLLHRLHRLKQRWL